MADSPGMHAMAADADGLRALASTYEAIADGLTAAETPTADALLVAAFGPIGADVAAAFVAAHARYAGRVRDLGRVFHSVAAATHTAADAYVDTDGAAARVLLDRIAAS